MLLPILILAQVAVPAEPMRAGGSRDSVVYKRSDEIRVLIVRADPRPVIDGRLDDAVWKQAQPMTRFVQYEPVDNVLPPQPSVGWVAYDAEFLYVAFRAYEARREDIRATVHPRERGGELDDKVAVAVDTYNDNRRTYVFRVSPIGLQFDGVKTEGQRTDDTPDLVWHSAARIDDEGWVAELAIPFASLRLPSGDSHDFGFDFVRYHGKAGVRSSWSPRRRGNPCDICQQGTLLGLSGVSTRRTVDVLPYVFGTGAGIRKFGQDSAMVGGVSYPTRPPLGFDVGDPRGAVGADVRIAITPSTTLNATINPDFSQVEADDEQIRVNQRFALFFQERRPFFLEGRDVFDVTRQGESGGGGGGGDGATGQLLYSRGIVNPSFGSRVTGKSGALQYGVLYARDDEPAWFSYEGHETSGIVPRTGTVGDVIVARLRRDVLADSWYGISLIGRRSGASRSGVAAGDMALRRGSLTLAAEAGWSEEREPNDSTLSPQFDGESRSGRYYRAQLARRGRSFAWSLSAAGLSPNFRNQLGRYNRMGIETYSARIDVDQYPNGRHIQQISQNISFTRTNVFGGGLLDYSIWPRLEVVFRQRAAWNLAVPLEYQTLLGAGLRQVGVFTDFRVEALRWIQFGGMFYAGDRELYDPNDPRVTKGVFGNLRVTLRPVPQAAVEFRGQRSNHYESWGRALVDDAKIFRLRGTYQLSPRLGVRVIGEYSNQFNRLVSNPLNRRTVRVSSSSLVTYELAPSSFLFFGYNDVMEDFNRPIVGHREVLRTGNQFFAKLSYLFRR